MTCNRCTRIWSALCRVKGLHAAASDRDENPALAKPNDVGRTASFCPAVLALALVILVLAGGCASYQVGYPSLFRPDVRTVHVPVFESDSFRRNLGERLTEAVVKEIESRTPYKVVGSTDADSILNGRIVVERKRSVAENYYDDVRDIETDMIVEVGWVSRRGEMLMQRSGMPFGPLNVTISEDSQFFPEAGQSLEVAQQNVIDQLAREIVGQMEVWW